MKTKYIAAVFVSTLALCAAVPASAQDYRGDYGYQRSTWRGHGAIIVRTATGQFLIDRRSQMFERLLDRPYNFRPGFTYVYTGRCSRAGCLVLEFAPGSREPTNRFIAPQVRFDFADYDNRYQGDRYQGDGQSDPNYRIDQRDPRDYERDYPQNPQDYRDDNAPSYSNDAPPDDADEAPPPAPDRGSAPQAGGHNTHRDNSGLLGGPNGD